jgi:hypothetical protein
MMSYLGAGELMWDGREVFDRTFAFGNGTRNFIVVPVEYDVLNARKVLLIHCICVSGTNHYASEFDYLLPKPGKTIR